MQSTERGDITDVLIDLIGTEDDGEERSDQATFSALQPSFNSAHVVAQSSARPAAAIGFSGSSSAGSSIRDRSGRFDFDRIREELSRASTPKSHSDASVLSWTRSNSSHAEGESSRSSKMRSTGISASSRSGSIASQTPTSLVPSDQGNSDRIVANPNPRDDQTLTLLSPLKLDPPLLGDSTSSPPPRTPSVPETQRPAEPSTVPTWRNMMELFDLMQSQMTALSRALELAQADSTVLRQRCLELESRLGIQHDDPVSLPGEVASALPNHQRQDDLREMPPPNDLHVERPQPANMDSALNFIRNIDELVWRRTLFAKSPPELAVLASLPDCVRNNHDILDSANLAALEDRICLWESIVRRTSD
ncbi:hypothetical protein RhiJN_20556 [Ceratobasidium sp. AG-Ba]|nr:hypothetical protein RhiJN_20556 [Ceratobasidium sp. AG-Ba]